MPLFEFRCSNCTQVSELFFHTWQASERRQSCRCGRTMAKMPSTFRFHDFKPFITRHLRPDGGAVEVRCETQLQDLMRRYGVVKSPLNDTVEGKADPREFLVKNPKPKKPKQLVNKVTEADFAQIAARAQATNFEGGGAPRGLRGL